MRDVAFLVFLAGLLALGLKRPFLYVLAYIYVDTVSPQRLSYLLLNSIPLSMIVRPLYRPPQAALHARGSVPDAPENPSSGLATRPS